jgi:hypothetical protein
MPRFLLLLLAVVALPVLAQEPNLSAAPEGEPGSAAQLVIAQRTYLSAIASGEIRPLLTAIQLARGITLRPATGWERTVVGAPPAEPSSDSPPPPDPASEAALTIARNLAGDDPDLQDLVWDLDAQLPGQPSLIAVEVRAEVAPGQTDEWRLPLFGEVSAEIGLIGNGGGTLGMTVRDGGGATICAFSASSQPVLCRLTPARNGFFTVEIRNYGETANSYRLLGN